MVGFEFVLKILTIIVVINIILIATTKGDILKEDEDSCNVGLIVTFLILLLPVGVFLAAKYNDKNNKPWYLKFNLCWFMPFGVYLLWSKNTFNKRKKIKLTVVSLISFLIIGGFIIGFQVNTYRDIAKYLSEKVKGVVLNEIDENDILYPFSQGGKIGYINKLGEIVIEPKYDNGDFFNEGLARVQNGNIIKYINKNDEELIVLPGGMEGSALSNQVVVINYSMNGFLLFTKRGVLLKEIPEGYIDPFNEGYAVVYSDGKSHLMDNKGELILTSDYIWLGEYSDGLIPMVGDNNLYGYIDINGQVVIEAKYQRVYSFHNGYAIVATESGANPSDLRGFKVIDKMGNVIKDLDVSGVEEYSEGKYQFFKDGDFNKSGYISETGDILIDTIYNMTYKFSEGLAGVKNHEDKLGFINDKNEIIIPFKYENLIRDFKNGVAIVENEKNQFVYIDKSGREIFKGEKFDMFLE